jgi:hypothetical protein
MGDSLNPTGLSTPIRAAIPGCRIVDLDNALSEPLAARPQPWAPDALHHAQPPAQRGASVALPSVQRVQPPRLPTGVEVALEALLGPPHNYDGFPAEDEDSGAAAERPSEAAKAAASAEATAAVATAEAAQLEAWRARKVGCAHHWIRVPGLGSLLYLHTSSWPPLADAGAGRS